MRLRREWAIPAIAVLCGMMVAAHRKGAADATYAVWLESLELSRMSAGWGKPMAGRSCEGTPITLGGVVYRHGVGTHAPSQVLIDLKRAAARFTATVGVDDERKGRGSVAFEIYADDMLLTRTPVLHGGESRPISADLTGKRWLVLAATDGGDGIDCDHADWADARILLAPGATERPQTANLPAEAPPNIVISTPPQPAIHWPRNTGCTPGRPFLFRIPATGQPPLRFSARNLPAGLRLDAATGIIAGTVRTAGTFKVPLTVRGPRGVASRNLTIVAGANKLALTPPMGWNSWYVWFAGVDDAKMRAAADGLVTSGLAAHGYQYVNIDDCWEGKRSAQGEIQPNSKFPDMKALGDYIHSRGLKFGIYTSPGPKTCGGYEGSWQHEAQDVRTYAQWGVDFVKHDWCSYGDVAAGTGVEKFVRPYRVMGEALATVNRDMVYSLCQYGMGDVWEWGAKVNANLWRTTGDSGDNWSAVSGIGFPQSDHARFAGPGRWNDPDMLMIGVLGGPGNLHPTHLTSNEQITQMSLWCMMAAPLIVSCDLKHQDPFTLAVLGNDEVIDVDQDPLGRAGRRVRQDGMVEVWSRPLWDGTTAVALFNRGVLRTNCTVRWSDAGIRGRQPVRDLWLHKNMGTYADSYSAHVPSHGCVMLKIGRPTHRE